MRVIVTGGTGSLGKILVKRILSGNYGTPKKLIIFSRDEAKQHNMRLDFMHIKEAADDVLFNNFKRLLEFRIGDVRHSQADITKAKKILGYEPSVGIESGVEMALSWYVKTKSP